MKKKSKPFSWKSAFRAGFEEKYVNLVIDSYHETLATNAGIKKVWENTRRNMLCSQMRKNKGKYGITFNIVAESEVWDENFKDKGRIDICCYLSELDEQYMAFECKRFLKNDISIWGTVSLVKNTLGETVVVLSFQSSSINFASDTFVEIEKIL